MGKNKDIILVLAMMLFFNGSVVNAVAAGPFGYDLQKDVHRNDNKQQKEKSESKSELKQNKQSGEVNSSVPARPASAVSFYSFVPMQDLYTESVDHSVYYPDATINSAIALYKQGNYTGCIQHLFSYIEKNPSDAYAFYYMGLAYSKIGEKEAAKNCYQKTINCNVTGKLLEQALKGRDCITGGTYCHAFDIEHAVKDEDDSLEVFINAPYSGHGFSPELELEYKQQQLNNLQKKINKNNSLDFDDMEKIQEIENKSEGFTGEKLAMAANITSEPTDTEVLEAIDVLKRAGLNISTAPNAPSASKTVLESSDVMPTDEIYAQNRDLQQLNMLLGNNNNNNDPVMNMLPLMLNAHNNGQNVDPQVVQSLMVNSMMNSFNLMNTNENR